MLAQGLEALRTGGVEARIPIIQTAVEQSKNALSQGLQQTEEQLALSGILKSPFGQRILAGQRIEGESAIGAIPTNIAQGMIQQIPQISGNQLGVAIQGMGSASNAASAIRAAEIQAFSQFLTTAQNNATQLGSMGMGGGKGAAGGGGF